MLSIRLFIIKNFIDFVVIITLQKYEKYEKHFDICMIF